jgi:hypothetical protein
VKGLFYVFNLAFSILETTPHNHPVADTLQVLYPVTLDWRHYAARLALHLHP